MTSVDDVLSPGVLFQGRFLIERPLGRGGMGEVWAALDTALERPVAIKIIHRALAGEARYAERFLRETKLVARVAHPNIVRLYDAGATASGRLFMVMERVFGVSLRQMMAGGARLDGVRALHYAIQIADALATAHEAELVHRDVKPENVLVSDGVHARLLDFGVAKDARGTGTGLTRQGVAVGTSRYMAPEQIAGSGAVDARADLYALGVVLYEMLAGAHPYAELDAASGVGETEIQAAHVHLEARPLPEVLPGCPAALWQAVATCLAKRPEERFARAGELAEVLRVVAQRMLSAGVAPGRSEETAPRLLAEGARARPAEMAPGLLAEGALGRSAEEASAQRLVEMSLGRRAEEGSARRLRSEVADAARVRAIRGSAWPGARRGEDGKAGREREPLRGLEAGGGLEGVQEPNRLAMAQVFEVAPAWGFGVVSPGEGAGERARSGDAAGSGLPRRPVPSVDEGRGAGVVAAGQGANAGADAVGHGAEVGAAARTLVSTEKWEGPSAAIMEPGILVSTEKWEGAAAVLVAMAGGERLAKTDPWEQRIAGAGMVEPNASPPPRTPRRTGLVVLGVLVLGLTVALVAALVAALARGRGAPGRQAAGSFGQAAQPSLLGHLSLRNLERRDIREVLRSPRCPFVSQQIVQTEERAEEVGRKGDLDAVGPRFLEAEPARVGEHVDALRGNADLQAHARRFEIAFDESLERRPERSQGPHDTRRILLGRIDPDVEVLRRPRAAVERDCVTAHDEEARFSRG